MAIENWTHNSKTDGGRLTFDLTLILISAKNDIL